MTSLLRGQSIGPDDPRLHPQDTLACTRCQPTEHDNQQLRQTIETLRHTMGAENNNLAEELAGARSTIRTLEGQLRAARAENTKLREDGPNAERVRLVLNCWVQGCGTRRADISMSSDRAALVFRMLKHRNQGARNADEQAQMLCRAIRGVALKPWRLFNDRYTMRPQDPRAKRMVRLEHCIGTDDRIEENLVVYRNACRSAAEMRRGIFELWQQASALEGELERLVSLPQALYAQGQDAEDVEAFLWERLAEREAVWDGLDLGSDVVPIRTEVAA